LLQLFLLYTVYYQLPQPMLWIQSSTVSAQTHSSFHITRCKYPPPAPTHTANNRNKVSKLWSIISTVVGTRGICMATNSKSYTAAMPTHQCGMAHKLFPKSLFAGTSWWSILTPLPYGASKPITLGYILFIGQSPHQARTVWSSDLSSRCVSSHIEFHVEAGLTATLLEAPDHLQGQLTIPPDHLRVCQLDNIATVGNAAGNSVNWLNLTGQPTVAPEYNDGYVFLYYVITLGAILTAGGRSGP